jgi:arylsulfatase A-like enzyme
VRIPRDPRLGAGGKSDADVQLVDIVPTILDALDLETPEGLDGSSLLEEGSEGAVTFSDLTRDGRKLSAVRSYPWKLVMDIETGESELYSVADPGGEEVAIDSGADPHTAEVRARLAAALGRILGQADSRGVDRRSAEEPVPEEVERALRALGYVE